MVNVLRLRALGDHRLWLRSSDGNEGIRDLADHRQGRADGRALARAFLFRASVCRDGRGNMAKRL
jgi:hypothetical protein